MDSASLYPLPLASRVHHISAFHWTWRVHERSRMATIAQKHKTLLKASINRPAKYNNWEFSKWLQKAGESKNSHLLLVWFGDAEMQRHSPALLGCLKSAKPCNVLHHDGETWRGWHLYAEMGTERKHCDNEPADGTINRNNRFRLMNWIATE